MKNQNIFGKQGKIKYKLVKSVFFYILNLPSPLKMLVFIVIINTVIIKKKIKPLVT